MLKTPLAMKRIVVAMLGMLIGVVIGITSTKYELITRIRLVQIVENQQSLNTYQSKHQHINHGAEALPPAIVEPTTDLYLRRLWGNPDEDLTTKPRYLVTFTVGFEQRDIISAAISKFSSNWTILLFHYDGHATEWDQYEWSKQLIHISARKQSKWWFAKRFLHPDVVASYEYIFIWDEDLGLEHFNSEEYIHLVKKHGLEISQPGLQPNDRVAWRMTMRLGNSEVHKKTEERPGWCEDPLKPPCAGFVEIMAPVFSRMAWRCVWNMIQNDLVHGWGLDIALGKCVEPAHEKIGVVDSQWIVHKVVPSLGNQEDHVHPSIPKRYRLYPQVARLHGKYRVVHDLSRFEGNAMGLWLRPIVILVNRANQLIPGLHGKGYGNGATKNGKYSNSDSTMLKWA